MTQPRLSRGAPSSLPSGEACDAGGPQGDDGFNTLDILAGLLAVCASTQPGPTPVTCVCSVDFDAEAFELGFGFGGEILRIGGQHARAAVEQHDAALGGVDVAEVVAHVELGDVADGAGELHAGGSAADDDEIERRVPALLEHLPLGQLKGQQHAAANLGGVFDGFEAGRERLPLVVAEIGVRGAGGENEIVVVEARAAGQRHLPRGDVDGDHLIHEHLSVALVAQNGADGLGDVGRREHGQRHLVEQRLKECNDCGGRPP